MKNIKHMSDINYNCLLLFSFLTLSAWSQPKTGPVAGTYVFPDSNLYIEKHILTLSENNTYCWERVYTKCCMTLSIYRKTYGKYELANDTLLLKSRKVSTKQYTNMDRNETRENTFRQRFTKKAGYQKDTITIIYDGFKIAKYGKIADQK